MKTPLEVLKQYFKYDAFRAPQEAIINTVLQRKDAIVLLPTGAGKSLCFQIPTLLTKGVCIVISPLIALMQDQVENLTKKGIKATAITSALKTDDIVQLFDNIRYGGIKFLYLSPERLQSEFIQDKIRQLNVGLIAIDEAHCISEWGHDFRPSYRKIAILKEMHPKVPLIALTATATTKVFNDIKINLDIKDAVVFKSSLKRPEISYHVLQTNAINVTVKELILKNNSKPTIVYTSSRKATKSISQYLNTQGVKSSFYHGGLQSQEKAIAYSHWLKEETPVMVATNAFGMGIDKNNVTTIIHAELPFSLENYMQESGRAGRNGQQANAYLLYNESSIFEFKKRFSNSILSIDYLKDIYIKLHHFFRIANGEKPLQQFAFNLTEFCNHYKLNAYQVFTAIDILNKEDIIDLNESLQKKSQVKLLIGHKQLLNYSENHKKTGNLLKTLLRTYGGLFDQYINIDEFILAKKLGLDKDAVIKYLNKLLKREIIDYKPVFSGLTIQFLVPREDKYTINTIAKNVKQRFAIKKEKVDAVLNYINNTQVCRSKSLLSYFGENIPENCKKCDVCLQEKLPYKHSFTEVKKSIITLLTNNRATTSREIVNTLHYNKEVVLNALQLLLDENKIALTSQNKFQVNKNA